MTRTAIICLAIVLALLGLHMLTPLIPGVVVAIGLLIEAVLIIAGSNLTK